MYHSCNIPDLVGHTIDQGRLRLVDTLGSGSNGVIFLAEETASGSEPAQYAVKCVVRADPDTRRWTLQQQEIHFHRILSYHPNVVTLHRVIEDKYYLFLVMDYCRGGDLFTYLSRQRHYRGDDEFIKKLFLQIVDALDACHQAGIYHRDLKPENILISEDANHIYLTDFGLATSNTHSKTYGAGSSLYMSPECIGFDPARPPYDTQANDVWALGVILTSMISGHNPWNNACPADACYRAYLHNDRFLAEMLPLSPAANLVLQHVFRPERARPPRIALPRLRAAVAGIDSFFMRPERIAAAGEYLRASAETYFEGSPHAARYLLPRAAAAASATSLARMEEGRSEGAGSVEGEGGRGSPSSVESESGPDTPYMRAQHPRVEVVDLTRGSGTIDSDVVEMPGGAEAKRLRSVSPGSILRRFMDRFFTEPQQA